MKNLIKAWENSPKYKLFYLALQRKRQQFVQTLQKVIQNRIQTKPIMTRLELEQTCDHILTFNKLPFEDREQFLLEEQYTFANIQKPTLYHDLTSILVEWYHHLIELKSDPEEPFELMAKVRDVIKLEISDFLLNLQRYSPEWEGQEDVELANELNDECKKFYNI